MLRQLLSSFRRLLSTPCRPRLREQPRWGPLEAGEATGSCRKSGAKAPQAAKGRAHRLLSECAGSSCLGRLWESCWKG